ncbi:DNA mismatch repair protein Mlh1-like [Euwallacea similis]|uniref:DNA mismatch repair protein Mlh1-like n=1 Tax=Euwallacea similis TaxID=1736056 RepID=UPI00344B3538
MEPKPIQKLEQEVVNRIAAGEVIQRPANALKELIENSLDAKATNIQITVKQGGLKLLQIQDNGTGIRKEDFEIVCERFTTSKIREFKDLHKISTYGFRGEALASISHIAHLQITSKTAKDICAYQAEYCDSKLKEPAKPIAGNRGTIITVEDLFYNMNVRRNALRSGTEEYQKISDVVSKYAIHNATVGFALKKHSGSNDLRTPENSNHKENIRLIYGSCIARELIEFEVEDSNLQFKCTGYITNVNYSTKKFQFLLFINHRLVDSQSLKKSIDSVYQTYLPKNSHPFVYLSLQLDPNNVDVNIHPTKHEVHFLNESQIIEIITNDLERKLLGSNSSRAFYTQSKLPNLQFDTREMLVSNEASKKQSEQPKFMVRTDANIQKLDKFFSIKDKSELNELQEQTHSKPTANMSLTEEEFQKHHEEFLKGQDNFEDKCADKSFELSKDVPIGTDDAALNSCREKHAKMSTDNIDVVQPAQSKAENNGRKEKLDIHNTMIEQNKIMTKDEIGASQEAKKCEKPLNKHLIRKITRVETKLTSILQLRKAIEENCHRGLRETFAQHVFVGSINPKQALIQFNSQLLLCNTKLILEELFYQFILYNFQNFDCYRFDHSKPIKELALSGLDMPDVGWTEEDGPKEELAARISEILIEKGPMLNEYFSIDIDSKGVLKSLPILLDHYVPDPLSLSVYLIRLSTEVNWESEMECFESFSRETALFYSNVSSDTNDKGETWKWITEYVLYPSIKEFFIPPKSFAENGAILEIANLSNLYKLISKLTSFNSSKQSRLLTRIESAIEKGNFSYYYVWRHGPIILNLTSLLGDADLYISDTNMYPTYIPDTYALHSATCGEEIIEIPESLPSPLSVGIYGYADSSFFVLDVYENPNVPYSYKHWVTIEQDNGHYDTLKEGNENNDNINNKNAEILKKNSKKKRSKTNSNIPSIFSVLEVLQMIFL